MSRKSVETVFDMHRETYASERGEWYENGYWIDAAFPERALETVEQHPEKTVVGPHRTETFASIRDEAVDFAAGLQELGLGVGDVVSFSLPNRVTTNAVYLGISLIGAVANPIVPIYRHNEFEYILNDTGASALVVPDEYRDFDYPEMIADIDDDVPTLEHTIAVGQGAHGGDGDGVRDDGDGAIAYESVLASGGDLDRPTLSPDDPHVIFYTSGTTSDPKGVIHTHNTMAADEVLMTERLGISETTKQFVPTPVTHSNGVINALEMPFHVGHDLVLQDRWEPAEAIEIIQREGCTRSVGATPFLKGLMEHAPEDWDSPLETVGCGGAAISPELVAEATEVLDCRVYRVYGMTEYHGVTKTPLDAPFEKCAGTDGKIQRGIEAKVVDVETGEELDGGDEEGEILLYGPSLMIGYLRHELHDGAFDGKYLKTGDLGTLDDDGYLTITGRKKDIIIRGGENIAVKEVEDALQEHPAIEEVAIVAMPDERLQEKGCAYVRLAAGAEFSFEDMVDYLDDRQIATQKYPERLEVIGDFPRTASGKIQKNELREDVAEKLDTDPVTR